MFPLSVMNLLLETTLFCTLCQNWLRLDPIKMRAKIFGMDKLSDLGHASRVGKAMNNNFNNTLHIKSIFTMNLQVFGGIRGMLQIGGRLR